jgi:hypothetical protein
MQCGFIKMTPDPSIPDEDKLRHELLPGPLLQRLRHAQWIVEVIRVLPGIGETLMLAMMALGKAPLNEIVSRAKAVRRVQNQTTTVGDEVDGDGGGGGGPVEFTEEEYMRNFEDMRERGYFREVVSAYNHGPNAQVTWDKDRLEGFFELNDEYFERLMRSYSYSRTVEQRLGLKDGMRKVLSLMMAVTGFRGRPVNPVDLVDYLVRCRPYLEDYDGTGAAKLLTAAEIARELETVAEQMPRSVVITGQPRRYELVPDVIKKEVLMAYILDVVQEMHGGVGLSIYRLLTTNIYKMMDMKSIQDTLLRSAPKDVKDTANAMFFNEIVSIEDTSAKVDFSAPKQQALYYVEDKRVLASLTERCLKTIYNLKAKYMSLEEANRRKLANTTNNTEEENRAIDKVRRQALAIDVTLRHLYHDATLLGIF